MLRERATDAADTQCRKLREKVITLGRLAFRALSTDARMEPLDNREAHDRFIVEQGLAGLDPADRQRLGNADDVREGRDRDRFAEREGFAALSPADRAIVGSPEALSAAVTAAQMVLHDRLV